MSWWVLGLVLLGAIVLVGLWALTVVSSREEARLRDWAGKVGVPVRRPVDEEDDWR